MRASGERPADSIGRTRSSPRLRLTSRGPSRPFTLARLALVLAAAPGCASDLPFYGTPVAPERDAPPLVVPAVEGGSAFDLAAERGRVVLVAFGYANCPDVCPTTMADWARVRRALGDAASGVRFVLVSVDPSRDTPQRMREFVRGFDSTFIGVVTDSAATARAVEGFGAGAAPSAMPGGSPPPAHAGHAMPDASVLGHGTRTYLVDRDGALRFTYDAGTPPDAIAGDLRRLVD